MKSKLMKAYAVVVLIIAIMYFLWYCFGIYIAGFIRECDRIKITDNNREEMVSLLKETIDMLIEESEGDDYYQKVPDINRAKEIECYRRFRHKDITIYYEDGAFYVLHMRNYDGEPLVSLIRDEGYNVYFGSLEFLADLIKPIIALIFVTLAVVVIRKN